MVKRSKPSKHSPNAVADRTAAVQAEIGKDPAYASVSPPLYLSSTYLWDDIETKGAYDYGRTVNPNRDALCKAIAALENGAGGVVTSSGMAAISTVLAMFTASDHIIAPHDCYGGTHRLLTHLHAAGKARVSFVDQNNAGALDAALSDNPKLLMIETPSNPLMRLVDIRTLSSKAKAAGALTVCDNTFLTPARQKPLDLGCDMVLHSTTKYINGHSDIIGGCVIGKTPELSESLAWWANCAGLTGAPLDAWLALRGLRTLHIRMDAQEANALALAQYLSKHKAVERVLYPGLKSHPQYKLAKAQQSGPGAMLAFEVKGGLETAKSVLSGIDLFQLAASLGGTESLICQPALMTHRGMSEDARAEAGIKDNLIRISVGLEDPADQIRAIEVALSKI